MKTSTTHQGRVALVTGAGQGIGQAIAPALAERGARVIATDLKSPHETVRKIGPGACALQLDVTIEDDWRCVLLKRRDVGDVEGVKGDSTHTGVECPFVFGSISKMRDRFSTAALNVYYQFHK